MTRKKSARPRPGWGGQRPSQTGRPTKTEPLIKTSITLSAAQVKRVTALALERETSIAEVIRGAVDALPAPKEQP